MPLLLKDATTFALRGQKRQRTEESGTAIYPIYINDESYDFQLVPSGSRDARVTMEPISVSDREGMYNMYLAITQDLYDELAKVQSSCAELLAEKHPGVAWRSILRPATDAYSATLKVKFYDDLQVYDEDGRVTKAPKTWRGARVVPILNVKAWVNEKDAGLWFTLAAVKITKPEPHAYTFV